MTSCWAQSEEERGPQAWSSCRASLEPPFVGDLHVAKPKRVSRSRVRLKVSSLDLAVEFASVHTSPLLGFCEGTLLVPHHLSAEASAQRYTLLRLRSHDTGLRTFSPLLRSLHFYFLR